MSLPESGRRKDSVEQSRAFRREVRRGSWAVLFSSIRTVTVGSGVSPDLLTFLPWMKEAFAGSPVARPGYRRWGFSPRPENKHGRRIAHGRGGCQERGDMIRGNSLALCCFCAFRTVATALARPHGKPEGRRRRCGPAIRLPGIFFPMSRTGCCPFLRSLLRSLPKNG
jgi:hypothetical protein